MKYENMTNNLKKVKLYVGVGGTTTKFYDFFQ